MLLLHISINFFCILKESMTMQATQNINNMTASSRFIVFDCNNDRRLLSRNKLRCANFDFAFRQYNSLYSYFNRHVANLAR
jgi:hypothetical protein